MAVGNARVQGLVCTRTQYELLIVGCRTACSSIALLLGSGLSSGTLALTAYSLLYATCVATTTHAIFGADNKATGATFSEATQALQSHVPPVPSIEQCKREQYSSITGGNFGGYPARCVQYASVGLLPPF